MQSGESDPSAYPGSDQGQEAGLPRGNKRPRDPSRTSLDTESTDAPSSSRSRPILNQPPSQRGSSRDTNEMHRSTTPPEASSSGTIKYTRTGRVSKATKGQRVHHCEECGKTYTRAEHLRRHQQNHKPGAFPCDVPGCGRSFYREDLLIRHKARHNDPNDPPSRRESVTSAPDAGGFAHPDHLGSARIPTTTASTTSAVAPELHADTSNPDGQQSSVSSRYQLSLLSPMFEPFFQFDGGISLAPKRMPIPPNELCPGAIPLAVGGPLQQSHNLWQPASPRTPPCYDYESSDEHSGPYFQPQPVRARQFSDAGLFMYDQPQSTSRSPASTGSSMVYPQWLYSTGSCTPYESGVSSASIPHSNSNMVAIPIGMSGLLPAEARDVTELQDLASAFHNITIEDFVDGSAFSREEFYLEAYWTWIHDLIPVVHRGTLHLPTASPLLRAAILALGAQALGGRDHLFNARNLHERSLKILTKRTVQDAHTYRVCDMQAILLIEVFSLFKSRRPPLQLSKSFEILYRHISNDPEALNLDLGRTDSVTLLEDYALSALGKLTKQRILLSCYALEQQHALLFGRASLDCFSMLPLNLPFPNTQECWDECQYDHTLETPPFERFYEALRPIPFMTVPTRTPHDIFISTIMLNCLCDSSNSFEQPQIPGFEDESDRSNILLAAERSPRARLTYHTFTLCKRTPVRALLAVAGESWVMSEKMSSQAEYMAAQLEVSQWVNGVPCPNVQGQESQAREQDISKALDHAFEILSIHQAHSRTGIMFQEWAVHLATIIIWAYVHITSRHSPCAKNGHSLDVYRLSHHELEVATSSILKNGSKGLTTWDQALCILTWTKKRLEKIDAIPHQNGLLSGALDVLGKLVANGNEEGRWF
ncbi:Zinc finger protein [Pseudocercospora fuligena]|uniref:Zinc finger protein n=1 Tax=Pseudocercospora fuligena TaxID=685502 RepID=A0A8H6VJ37_9PEZI|nr:Zinc finger protein [Pseudocercospora fuligena]